MYESGDVAWARHLRRSKLIKKSTSLPAITWKTMHQSTKAISPKTVTCTPYQIVSSLFSVLLQEYIDYNSLQVWGRVPGALKSMPLSISTRMIEREIDVTCCPPQRKQIGRASCRESVCQYV